MHAKKTIKNFKIFYKDIKKIVIYLNKINIGVGKLNPLNKKRFYLKRKKCPIFGDNLLEVGLGLFRLYFIK